MTDRKNREAIPAEVAALVLFRSDRICCVCQIRRPVQIHHIDEDPSNNDPSNLAVLCFDCHRETQIQGGFDRKIDARQVTLYRDNWLRIVAEKRQSYSSVPNSDSPQKREQGPELMDSTGEYLLHAEEPIILWRMPRGVLVLEDLLPGNDEAIANYCLYDGSWRGGTHYHTSYHSTWWGNPERIEGQCRKLQIERGDWDYATRPIKLMCDIADGRLRVGGDGRLTGDRADRYDEGNLMSIFVQEDVPFPRVPEMYFRLAISGRLRDLAAEVDDFCLEFVRTSANRTLTNIASDLNGFRRTARIETYKVLRKDDPATVNLLEVLDSFVPDANPDDFRRWSRELQSVLHDAITQVHENTH